MVIGIEALRRPGATVQTVSIPGLRHTEFALIVIETSETSTVHHANLRDRPEDYGDDVGLLLECGELPSAIGYLQAQQVRRSMRREVHRTFERVDVLIGPTLGSRTSTIGASTALVNGAPVNAIDSMICHVGPASLLGLPCLSVPVSAAGWSMDCRWAWRSSDRRWGSRRCSMSPNAFEQTEPFGGRLRSSYLA